MSKSPSKPTLETFLSTVFTNLKSPKEKAFLQDLTLIALEKDITSFPTYLDSLSVEQLKIAFTDKVKMALSKKVAKQSEFTQDMYDLLKNKQIALELRHLITIKKSHKFKDGVEIFERLIQEQSPQNERVSAIYDLMSDYTKSFDLNTNLNLDVIEKYKQKINPKNVEKEVKNGISSYWVNKYGIKVHPLSSARYKKKEVFIKSKVKTQDQKGFDQVYSIFLYFLAKHLREDFLSILDILDLDVLTVFKKVSAFSSSESLDIWKSFTENLDIKSYYDSLDDKSKIEVNKLFTRIQENINKVSSKKIGKYTFYNNLNFLGKGTKENMKNILTVCLMMKNADFSVKEIVNSFLIFETDLKRMYPSNSPMPEFLFSFLPSKSKDITKEQKEKLQELFTEWEKQSLEAILAGKSASLEEKKINIKKYKI